MSKFKRTSSNNEKEKSTWRRKILEDTPPARGITERITNDKVVLHGSRDGVDLWPNGAVKRGFMDDIYKITKYFTNNIEDDKK